MRRHCENVAYKFVSRIVAFLAASARCTIPDRARRYTGYGSFHGPRILADALFPRGPRLPPGFFAARRPPRYAAILRGSSTGYQARHFDPCFTATNGGARSAWLGFAAFTLRSLFVTFIQRRDSTCCSLSTIRTLCTVECVTNPTLGCLHLRLVALVLDYTGSLFSRWLCVFCLYSCFFVPTGQGFKKEKRKGGDGWGHGTVSTFQGCCDNLEDAFRTFRGSFKGYLSDHSRLLTYDL